MLLFAETTEYKKRFSTGVPVKVAFVRNTRRAPRPPPGDPYQQLIEPAGRYMLHNPSPGDLPPGWEKGVVTFKSPLVLWFNEKPGNYYDDRSWKMQLAKSYGKRGLALSQAIVRSGYDAIVTVMPETLDTREIVDLTRLTPDREIPRAFGSTLKRYLNSTAAYRLLDAYPETKGTSWQAGACWPLAEALHSVLPSSELRTVVDDGVQHHVVAFWRDLYFDADGVSTEAQLLKRWKETESLRAPRIQRFSSSAAKDLTCPVGLVQELRKKITLIFKESFAP